MTRARRDKALGVLGCDDKQLAELVDDIEHMLNVTITDDELDQIPVSASWQKITVLELANLVRDKNRM